MTKTKKRENFKRIANRRVNHVLDEIRSFRSFKNTSFYDCDEKDLKAIFKAIQEEIKETSEFLFDKSKKKGSFRL